MSLPSFSVHQRVLVNLLFIGLMAMGWVSFRRTPKEIYPDVTFNEAYVFSVLPGASPREVEDLLSKPIEEAISDVPNVDYIKSTSRESLCLIGVMFEDSVEDMNEAVRELRGEVSKLRDLPKDATDPMVIRLRIGEHYPCVIVCLAADLHPDVMRELSDGLSEELLRLDGVRDVDVDGTMERVIHVEVDPAKLDQHHMSLHEITQALAMRNLNVPCGSVQSGRSEWIVRLVGKIDRLDEIGNVVVRSGPGGLVKVSDVAAVKMVFQEPTAMSRTVRSRMDGAPCIALSVIKTQEANVLAVVDRIREKTEQYLENFPEPVSVFYRQNTAEQVRSRLIVLWNNGMIGMVLVGISLTLFVGPRGAILAAIGIPFTFLCTTIFLDFSGTTINVVSVFAFLLVLGMVVDDAIVVIENAYRHMEMGASPEEAAVKGSEEVMWPVTAAVLTTMAAFIPLLTMGGRFGKFMSLIPKVVTFVLLASILEAIIVLPSHLADFGGWRRRRQRTNGNRLLDQTRSFYVRLLRVCTRHRYLTVLAVLAAATGCVIVGRSLDRTLLVREEEDQIQIQFAAAPGSSLETTDAVARRLEEMIAGLPQGIVAASLCRTGMQEVDYEPIFASHHGQFDIDLVLERERIVSLEEALRMMRERSKDIPGISTIRFGQPVSGAPLAMPVEVRVKGPDLQILAELAEEVVAELHTIDGVTDILNSHEAGKGELRIVADPDKAAMVGLDLAQIALAVRTATEGTVATEVTARREGEQDIDVIVRLAEGAEGSLAVLEEMRIMSRTGRRVALAEVADLELVPGVARILRRDQERVVVVTADIDEDVNNLDAVNRKLKKKFSDVSLTYPQYSLEFGGDYAELERSFHDLYVSLGIAVLAVYVILGAEFKSFTQPIIVMATVPFAFIGVVLGLVIMKMLFNVTAFVAIVALAGIVVNDSLVLVDFINRLRDQGLDREEAVIQAGVVRMRPIILTSVTTILGLLPLTLGLGGASRMWSPMAAAICWGLTFSTLLTLFVIPAMQRILDDVQGLFSRMLCSFSEKEKG